jgi:hypothetical protein
VPAGVVTHQVCTYDGGLIATGGYNEIFLKGFGEPALPCGDHPYPGESPYIVATQAPLPTPSPSPSPSPH